VTTGSTTHTAANIAEHIGGTLAAGPADTPITGISDFNEAQPGDITLIGTQRYADRWPSCPATAALVLRNLNCPDVDGKTLIHVDNADLSFSKTLALFAPPPIHTEPGVHPTATVHPSATFGKDVSIGAYCTIGPGVVLGDRCTLYNNVTILDHSQLGDDGTVWPGVVRSTLRKPHSALSRRPTSPPRARAMSWCPRQMPIRGISRAWASLMSSSSLSIHGSS